MLLSAHKRYAYQVDETYKFTHRFRSHRVVKENSQLSDKSHSIYTVLYLYYTQIQLHLLNRLKMTKDYYSTIIILRLCLYVKVQSRNLNCIS